MSIDTLLELEARGRRLLAERDFRAAAKTFQEALALAEKVLPAAAVPRDSVPIRNNLALALFVTGEPLKALEVLRPYLGGDPRAEGNPFTYALAARVHASQGQEAEARRWLERAVTLFGRGLSAILRGTPGMDVQPFLEYTVAIMEAAAALKDHRQVLDLYRRWEPHHVRWQNRYLAAVACFNLGRYRRAAALWGSLGEVYHPFAKMGEVALRVERGMVPPFELGYEIYSREELDAMLRAARHDEAARRRFVEDGYCRMVLLVILLEGQDKQQYTEAGRTAYQLVYYGGEWGERFGRRILEGPGYAVPVKMQAARALAARGILSENEPVPMWIDGRWQPVEYRTLLVTTEPEPDLDARVEEAIRLREAGRVDEAEALLRELCLGPRVPARAVMTLANLLRGKGQLDEAVQLMNLLENLIPDHPAFLFNYAALMLQKGDTRRAREYFERIDVRETSEEFRAKLEVLREEIARAEEWVFSPAALVRAFEEQRRKAVEEKPLGVDASLVQGLRNMPARWLEAACRSHGLEPVRYRKERQEQLRRFFLDRANLEKAVAALAAEERELLRYLMERGGWARLSPVTRRFGSLEGDGFFWDECGPKSPLGVLWSRALVMVGRTALEGRRCKVAVVPAEMRPALAEILGVVSTRVGRRKAKNQI
ncbi:MAG: tetratricopeptide repeat protein [Desulfotomaculales bacterium]